MNDIRLRSKARFHGQTAAGNGGNGKDDGAELHRRVATMSADEKSMHPMSGSFEDCTMVPKIARARACNLRYLRAQAGDVTRQLGATAPPSHDQPV